MTYTIHHGNCLDILPTIPSGSIDAVITDPPYPEISRDYGRLTEDEWWALMMGVCTEVRRVLKPTGSAVFILQPNSRKVGSMRGWLWRFMWWVTTDWNMVQDVWWWNYAAMPSAPSIQGRLTRPSVKACVWAGNANCWRNQNQVLTLPAQSLDYLRRWRRDKPDTKYPSGHHAAPTILDKCLERDGSTPFNLLPVAIDSGLSKHNTGATGHGAGTPLKLADWWTRYIVPAGGTVLDPFNGAGTMGVAALQNGAHYIGIEQMAKYVDVTHERLAKVQPTLAEAAD